jgi:hypothetical protein
VAKILISNQERTMYLSGNLSEKRYFFTDNKHQAFCFDNEREAVQFEEEPAVAEFLEDELTDLVDYETNRSIYSV